MKFISLAVVIIFHGLIVFWCGFKAISTHLITEIQYFIGLYWGECLSIIRVDVTQWGVTECDSFYHFNITSLHISKYTFYGAVWLRAMLIVLNYFGLSTYILTEKRWIGGLHNMRTNTTLKPYIYLCWVDTWITTVYVELRLLLMCLCVPVLVDLCICCIKKSQFCSSGVLFLQVLPSGW